MLVPLSTKDICRYDTLAPHSLLEGSKCRHKSHNRILGYLVPHPIHLEAIIRSLNLYLGSKILEPFTDGLARGIELQHVKRDLFGIKKKFLFCFAFLRLWELKIAEGMVNLLDATSHRRYPLVRF